MITAADGRSGALFLDAVPSLAWLAAAAALGVAAPALFDPHPAPLEQWLLGLVLHLLSGLTGLALAFLLHALGMTRGAQTLTIVASSVASALVPHLPPIRPLLQAWTVPRPPPGTAMELWSLLGPALLTTALTIATAALPRRL